MKKTIAAAVVVFIAWCACESALAQSALHELEERIRAQRAPGEPQADPRQQDEADGGAEAAPKPAGGPDAERGYLGLVADDRKDRGRGVRILELLPEGPADKAGLAAGDLIVAVDTVRIRQMNELGDVLGHVRAGDKLTFDVLRGQNRLQIEVTFGHRPPPDERRFQHLKPPAEEPAGREESAPEPAPECAPVATNPLEECQARIELLELRVNQLERRIEELERALEPAAKTDQ